MVYRNLTEEETVVVSFLLRAAKKDDAYISNFISETQCSDMNDGGMGSLHFMPCGQMIANDDREFGCEMSACHFTDEDGVLVCVALYADSSGHPFELDVWKVDFSPLIRMPNDESKLCLDAMHHAADFISESQLKSGHVSKLVGQSQECRRHRQGACI